MNTKKALLIVLLVVFLAACALDVRTTGFLDRSAGIAVLPNGATFAVLENAAASNPIFDREIKAKIERLLVKAGYRLDASDKARYQLSYGYGIASGLRSRAVTSYGPPQTQIITVSDGKGGVATQAVMTPGTASVIPMVSVEYTKQLTLKVTEAAGSADGRKESVVWMGETLSMDPSSDLRTDIDYLLVVAFMYFGRDTGKQVSVSIGRENSAVDELRRDFEPLNR
jgi:hypothetical protein